MQERETRETGLACGQSFLNRAICFLCRPSVSGLGDHEYSQGTAPGTENDEGSGKAIHARAVEAGGTAWSGGD